MHSYRQGIFRNSFEERIFDKIRRTCRWCVQFADRGYAGPLAASVFHNVETRDFHGTLSDVTTFAGPQSREIDILLEVYEPQQARLLVSCKDLMKQVQIDHVSDYEALLNALRSSAHDWMYWAMVVAQHGFQSGCEDTAKRADIALIPPVTGNVVWLKYLSSEDVAEMVQDAIKVFLLGEIFWLDASSYSAGNLYNAMFIVTREPSGMLGQTKIRKPDGRETQMEAFVDEAMAKEANKYRIPLSRRRTYIPLFDPPRVQSMDKRSKLASSPVRSVTISPATGIDFFRVRTAKGRELIADRQRAVYTPNADGSRHRLVRIDKLRVGTKIICVSEDGATTELDEVREVETLR